MDKVNMNRFVKNVKFLCKEKNIKIGVLEKNVGICVGRIARLKQNGSISLNAAYGISKILETSLDDLLETDIELKYLVKKKREELEELLVLSKKEKWYEIK